MAGVITEIAAECGVSEQAVRAWCRRNHVAKDAKSEQLAVKDKQIEELNARLAEVSSALVAAQQTAQAAQALHAGTIQQQITSRADQSEGSGDEPKKQGWFSRLFRG